MRASPCTACRETRPGLAPAQGPAIDAAPAVGQASAVTEPRPPIPFRDPETRSRFKRVADRVRIALQARLDRARRPIEGSAGFAFVLGCGHSGTTLIASRLGNHPAVALIPQETNLFEPRRPLAAARRRPSRRARRGRGRRAQPPPGKDPQACPGHRPPAPPPARGAADRRRAQPARHLSVAPPPRRHARRGHRPLAHRQRRRAAASPPTRWRGPSTTRRSPPTPSPPSTDDRAFSASPGIRPCSAPTPPTAASRRRPRTCGSAPSRSASRSPPTPASGATGLTAAEVATIRARTAGLYARFGRTLPQ